MKRKKLYRSPLVISAEKNIREAYRLNNPKGDADDWIGLICFAAMFALILFFVRPL